MSDDPASPGPRRPASHLRRRQIAAARPVAGAAAPGLRISVSDGRGRALRVAGLGAWLAAVIGREARGEAALAIVSDATMRRLNREFRGVDRVTDVLSFPNPDSPFPTPDSRLPIPHSPFLGDIVIARGRAAAQARDAAHSLGKELRVLALHGLLHLLGYDHESDDGEMARKERRLRRQGGLEAGLIERGALR